MNWQRSAVGKVCFSQSYAPWMQETNACNAAVYVQMLGTFKVKFVLINWRRLINFMRCHFHSVPHVALDTIELKTYSRIKSSIYATESLTASPSPKFVELWSITRMFQTLCDVKWSDCNVQRNHGAQHWRWFITGARWIMSRRLWTSCLSPTISFICPNMFVVYLRGASTRR